MRQDRRLIDLKLVITTAVAAAAFACVALWVDEPARTPAIQALTYFLAWRLTLAVYTRRKRNRWVILSLPLMGGAWIGEWWAVALALVNPVMVLVFGPRRDMPVEPVTRGEIATFTLIEAALLAVGIALRQLVW